MSDIDISKTLEFHKEHGKLATMSAVLPPGRFGALKLDKGNVVRFREKPKGDGAMINGGFFVLNPEVINLIANDKCIWEEEPLTILAEAKQLMAFEHPGFWQPMDTLRDKKYLEKLWLEKKAPWKTWK